MKEIFTILKDLTEAEKEFIEALRKAKSATDEALKILDELRVRDIMQANMKGVGY